MTRRFLACGLVVLAVGVAARADDKAAKPAETATDTHPAFEKLKGLAGTWVEADKDGKPTATVVSVIKVTAAGSAVHETLFPGQPHEMISVYHLDKGEVVMTHYCALGNQPKVKLDPKSTGKQLRFVFAGGTKLDPAKDRHMHGGTLTLTDADHIEFTGEAWENGQPCKEGCGTMKLVRKK